jgi:hypothetical protein
MATRMQQRRGTAAQWISTNSGNGPILNAGEIGFETDTNRFKIGDGTNHWINLDYFIDANSTVNPAFGSSITFEGATANAFETTVQVTDPTADRTITFPDATGTVVLADGSGNVTVSGDLTVSGTTTTINSTTINATTGIVFEGATADAFETTLTVTDPTADRTITFPDATGTVALTSDIAELSQDAIDAALTAGTGITKTYNDAANTLTVAVDTTTIQARVADVSDTEIGYLNGVTSAIQTQINDKAPLASPTFSGTVSGVTATHVGLGNVDNTSDANKPVSTAQQTALDLKAPLNSPTFTGTVTLPANTISQSMMGDDSVGTNEIGGLAVTEAKIADGAVTSVKIANGTIVNEDINASAAIALSKLATDPLARANHTGTQAASTISDFDTQVRTSKVTDLTAPTASFSMNSQKITGLATPTDSTDAATKAYVDAVTEGLHIHAAAIAATTANVTLASALENGDTLDGVTLATGDRILVKNQTTTSENGIYIVQASGQPTRATDFDTAAEVDSGDFIFVSSGTVNGSTGWVQTNKPATIGTDPILFTQFAGAGTYTAGTGLTLTGTVFSINTGTTVDLSTEQTLTNKTLTSPKINENVALTASATELNILDGATLSTTELNYVDGVTSAIQTQLDAKIAKADISAKGAILVGTGSGTYTAQSVGTNGQVLTANSAQADGVEWTTVSSYSAPTLGSTSIASGATVTTIVGLTKVRSDVFTTLDANGYEVDIETMTIMGAF